MRRTSKETIPILSSGPPTCTSSIPSGSRSTPAKHPSEKRRTRCWWPEPWSRKNWLSALILSGASHGSMASIPRISSRRLSVNPVAETSSALSEKTAARPPAGSERTTPCAARRASAKRPSAFMLRLLSTISTNRSAESPSCRMGCDSASTRQTKASTIRSRLSQSRNFCRREAARRSWKMPSHRNHALVRRRKGCTLIR